MGYILDNKDEVYRLHKQSESQSYQLSQELQNPDIIKGSDVLEIGCGAGTLINHLKKYYHISAHACDLQQEHIEYCIKNIKGVEFSVHDILEAPYKKKVDHIFMRYITHHLGVEGFQQALTHIKNSMKPNAKITIIDVDGLIANIGTLSNELSIYIDKVKNNFCGDLYMGRKIPELLYQNNFTILDTQLQTIDFKGDARELEIEQWRKRFDYAREAYIEILGSEIDFKKFQNLFFQELSKSHIPFFLNKIITHAQLN